MSRRGPQKAYAAFCEEFDEDADVVIPDTRKVANVAAKRSQPELPPHIRGVDGSSDSGYSSRTAATVGSGDSFMTSGTEHTSLDASITNTSMSRFRELTAEREKAKPAAKGKDKQGDPQRKNPANAGKTQPTRRQSSSRPAPLRSTSKSEKRDSVSLREPCTCWDCERQMAGYQQAAMTPTVDQIPYGHHHMAQSYDYPPSPQAMRYPPMINQDNSPAPPTSRTRANAQNKQTRPTSYHGGTVPDMGMSYFHMGQTAPYESGYGPPLSASAYSNTFFPYPYVGNEPGSPYPSTAYDTSQVVSERPTPQRTSSARTPSKPTGRRQSIYGSPVVEYAKSSKTYQSGGKDRQPSRERRPSQQPQAYDPDEDYYRMPPPPLPAPQQQAQKSKPPPQVIPIPNSKRPNIRKSNTTATAAATPSADRDGSFDMAQMKGALPAREGREQPRDPVSPERRPSMPTSNKNRVRTTSYHNPGRAGQAAIENRGRNRRQSVYGVEQPKDLENKQREAQEYQAARAPRPPPLNTRSLRKARQPESDSDSQHSQSDSSSDGGGGGGNSQSQTKYGSGAGSTSNKADDDDGITMVVNGVKIGFSADSDRQINVRSGEEGSFELNIGGNKRSNKYLLDRSDTASASASGRAEIDDVRQTREDVRSERTSRRSSRSGYSGRGLLE